MSKISRRSLVTTAAALPALAVPAAASPAQKADPIFAALETYRGLDAAYYARSDYEDSLGESGVKLHPAPDDHRTPEMVAHVTASVAAREALANTAPTTMAGLVAFLDFAVSEAARLGNDGDELPFDGEEEMNAFIQSLHRGASQIAREAAQS
jgi:hypothetical protein